MSHSITIEQIKDHILELKESNASKSEIREAEEELKRKRNTNETVKEWTTQKPDFACVFLTRNKSQKRWEYDIYRFEWCQCDPPIDEGEETSYYYLAWLDKDGEEIDDIAECACKEFFIIETLPTMDEVHNKWVQSLTRTTKETK